MKKAKKFKNGVLKVVERIAWNEVEKNMLGGSPACAGIYHQPKRPKGRLK